MQRVGVAAKPIVPDPRGGPREAAPQLSDAVLLQRVGAGDTSAFALLLDRHLLAVTRIARRMLGDDAEAEDVAQEAMLKLWRLGPALTIEAAGVRPWLSRVVSNLVIDRVRVRRRTDVTDTLPEVPAPATQVRDLEAREVAARIDAALQALPERQRLALTLFHFEGLSQIEVAASMGVSDEAVESLLARGRRSLRAALAGEWRALIAADDAP